jgi:hypothetical protein
MELKKVKVIIKWEAPRFTRDVRVFIGFANYY